jgi:antitoxin MazE
MKTRIVRVSKSRGLRIPNSLLDETGLDGEVDIAAMDKSLIIRPVRRPRDGWA